MDVDLLRGFSTLDWIGLAIFFAGWIGYGHYADREARGARGLRGATHAHRLEWARQMVRRENRIVDSSLIGNLMNSVSFYASTTTYIIAGLIAVAGTLDKLVSLTSELPFTRVAGRGVIEVKVFLLVGIFVFAYFKFTWSLRQFNYLSILFGAAPNRDTDDEVLERYARKCATLNTLAGDEFNRGIRAYYFGFAAGTWFFSPGIFLVFTLVIIAVMWRRDFHSHTLRALSD